MSEDSYNDSPGIKDAATNSEIWKKLRTCMGPADHHFQQENIPDEGWNQVSENLYINYRNKREGLYEGKQSLPGAYRDVAIKIIDYDVAVLGRIELFVKSHHPNIIKIYETGLFQSQRKRAYIYIAMQSSSKSLRGLIDENQNEPVDFVKYFSYARQIVEGVAFIHEHGLLHGNINLDNIVLSSSKDKCIISDLDLCSHIQEVQSAAAVMSSKLPTGFEAPETLGVAPKISPRSDSYSIGMALFVLFSGGAHPFGHDFKMFSAGNQDLDLSAINKLMEPYREEKTYLLDLIDNLLSHDPGNRLKPADILQHRFFKDSAFRPLIPSKNHDTYLKKDSKNLASGEVQSQHVEKSSISETSDNDYWNRDCSEFVPGSSGCGPSANECNSPDKTGDGEDLLSSNTSFHTAHSETASNEDYRPAELGDAENRAPAAELLGRADSEIGDLPRTISIYPEMNIGHSRDVFKGRCKERKIDLAVKVLRKNNNSVREAMLLLRLDHENIVKIIAVGIKDGTIPDICIAMELHPENLAEFMERNREKQFNLDLSFSFSKQLVTAVVYLHGQGIVHRDLKPFNILLSDCGKIIKVTDMGLSRAVSEGETSIYVTYISAGTNGYKAPETYLRKRDDGYRGGEIDGSGKYAYSSDIFPLGINIYFIFSNGKHPFGDNPDLWIDNIKKHADPKLDEIPKIEGHGLIVALLKWTLNNDPKERPTADQILRDQFFTDGTTRGDCSEHHLQVRNQVRDTTPKKISSTQRSNSYPSNVETKPSEVSETTPKNIHSTQRSKSCPSKDETKTSKVAESGESSTPFELVCGRTTELHGIADYTPSERNSEIEDTQQTIIHDNEEENEALPIPEQNFESEVQLPEPAREEEEHLELDNFQEDRTLFENESNTAELDRIRPLVLHNALKSNECLKRLCAALVAEFETHFLEDFLLEYDLVGEVKMHDIEERYKHPQKVRRMLLREMCVNRGEAVNPRILITVARRFEKRKIYDVLCNSFIEHLKGLQNT